MKQTIFGEWTSQDGAGNMYRYIFNENGTYTYATRSGDEAWHTQHQGQFLYENQLLSLQYADGKWYNIGYVGIEGDEMVEGFKRVSGSTGLEGDWMLDASGLQFTGMTPRAMKQHTAVTFKDGNMNGTCENLLNGKVMKSNTFTGKYTAEGDTVTFYDTVNVKTAYLEGIKKICLLDNVLGLLGDVTCNAYFKRTSGCNLQVSSQPVKMDKAISQFTVYAPTGIGYAFWIRVDFKDPKELQWHTSDRGPSVTVWFKKSMKLADIVGLKEGMDVRLNIEVQAGSNNVRANQYFTYKEDAALSAYYEATGTSLDAAVTFIDYKEV